MTLRVSLRDWLLAAFALSSIAYALLLPLGSQPDESAHVIYGAAVIHRSTDVAGQPGQVAVSAGVASTRFTDCTHRRPAQTPRCQPRLSSSSGTAIVATAARGYPKLYYALVSWPTLFGHFTSVDWYLMRLTSVLLCTVLLGIGFICVRASDATAPVIGVLLASSPAVLSVASAVNPSGPELAAAIGLAVSEIAMFAAVAARERVRALRCVGPVVLLAGYLSVARPGTWVLAGGIITVIMLGSVPAWLPAVRGRWRLASAVVLSGLAGVVLVFSSFGSAQAAATTSRPRSWPTILSRFVLPNILSRMQESAGQVTDQRLQLRVIGIWLLALLVMVGASLVVGSWWQRVAVLAAALAALVVGPAFVFHSVLLDGTGYQARYALGLFAIIPILAVAVIYEQRTGWLTGSAVAALPLLWALLLLASLCSCLARFAVGRPVPSNLISMLAHSRWLPPAWPVLLVAVAGVLYCATRIFRELAGPPPVTNHLVAAQQQLHARSTDYRTVI